MGKDATSFLMGGGLKGARFIKGQPVRGLIIAEPEVRQQTDYNTKEPKFFKTGEPMMQLVVTVKTDQRDPDTANDDGTRGFYIKNQVTKVIREAVRAAAAPSLEIGGELTLTWVSGGPRYEGDNAWQKDSPKVMTATYIRPTAQAAATFLNGSGEPTPTQQYAPGFAPQPAFTGPTPATTLPPLPVPAAAPAGYPAPAGVDPTQWAAIGPEQQRTYLAQLGQPVG